MQEFIEYCSLQFIILKFKIRNLKAYNKKLLVSAQEIKKEKFDKALVVENNKLILYKMKILKIVKKFKRFLIRETIKAKKKSYMILNNVKISVIKVISHLKGFCIYCFEQLTISKLKFMNQIHHVKLIKEINENIHIEETRNALILSNTGIVRFKEKILVKILILLKVCQKGLILLIAKITNKLILVGKKVVIVTVITCKKD